MSGTGEHIDGVDVTPPIDLTFTAAGNLYATHAIHAFAARCPPPLVDWAITQYSAPGETVLDPMAGSGTSLLEACVLGRAARGAEIDPLARLIAKTKATLVDIDEFDKAITQLERLLGGGARDDGWRPDLPDLNYWFREDVSADLARLRVAIRQLGISQDVRDVLWVAFSSLIVGRTSVANARDLVHSRHHHRPWTTNPDVPARFLTRTRQIRRMVSSYRTELDHRRSPEPDVAIVGEDARALPLNGGSVDLIFTSPPYCSALDYTRAHIFAVGWLADILATTVAEYRSLGRRYVGSERAPLAEAGPSRSLPPALGMPGVDQVLRELADSPKRAWIVHRYFRDMAMVIAEAARVVKPGGHVVLVVCPSNIRRIPIATHRLLAEIAHSAPVERRLALIACYERTIHDHRRVMPYLEAAFGPRMRTEYVLVLRRPAYDHDPQRRVG